MVFGARGGWDDGATILPPCHALLSRTSDVSNDQAKSGRSAACGWVFAVISSRRWGTVTVASGSIAAWRNPRAIHRVLRETARAATPVTARGRGWGVLASGP